MKKIIVTCIIILQITLNCFAQITLEQSYSTDAPIGSIKLSLSGDKYIYFHNTGGSYDTVKLYNANHSVFKTISVPQISGLGVVLLSYVSETLFNLDTLVEYMVLYHNQTNTIIHTYVYNENGIIQ